MAVEDFFSGADPNNMHRPFPSAAGLRSLDTMSSPTGRLPESTRHVDFNTWFTENPQLDKVRSVLERTQMFLPIGLSADASEALSIIRGAMTTNCFREAVKLGSSGAGNSKCPPVVPDARKAALQIGATELQGSGLWVVSETQISQLLIAVKPAYKIAFCPFCGLRNRGPHKCDPPKD